MPLTSTATNRVLWTAQVLLALLFLFAGVTKFVMTPEQLQGPIALPLAFMQFIGAAETLGALGLLLPGMLGIKTELIGLAAAGLTVIMLGATGICVAGFGLAAATFPLVVGIVAAAVAYGRWELAPSRSDAIAATA